MLAASATSQHHEDEIRLKLEFEQQKRETVEKEFSDKLSEERMQCQNSHDLLIGQLWDILNIIVPELTRSAYWSVVGYIEQS